jgi:hypothetical protein
MAILWGLYATCENGTGAGTTCQRHSEKAGLLEARVWSHSAQNGVRFTALKHHCLGLVRFHDAVDDWLEKALICVVIDPVPQRHIDSIVLAGACTDEGA